MSRGWLLGLAVLLGCPATPGVTCRKHEDCASLSEGYCAKAEICTRVCETSEQCPAGAACVTAGHRRVCLSTCESDDDCIEGFSCQAGDEGAVCRLSAPLEPPS